MFLLLNRIFKKSLSNPLFVRNSVAIKSDSSQVENEEPRYERGCDTYSDTWAYFIGKKWRDII